MSYVPQLLDTTIVGSVYGNVEVRMSTDGGTTYPYTVNSGHDCGDFDPGNPTREVSIPVVLPAVLTDTARFLYSSVDVPDMTWESNVFRVIGRYEELEDQIRSVMVSLVGDIPMAWNDQNAPRVAKCGFVGMRLSGLHPLGFSGSKSQPTGTLEATTITTDQEVTLLLVGYGTPGSNGIELIYDAVRGPVGRRAFYSAGIAFVDHTPMMNVSEVVNSRMEARRVLDLRLRVAHRLSYVTPIIDAVNIRLVLKRGSTIVVDKLIEVN